MRGLSRGGASYVLSDLAERNAARLPYLIGAGLCLLASAGLALAVKFKEPLPAATERISDTGTLLVVMRDGCGWCDKFQEELGPTYRRSDLQSRAPLRYVDAADVMGVKSYKLKSPVYGTPTLVMLDTFGREVGRYPGYPGSMANLNTQVEKFLRRVK
jgi:hypothetical protein